MDKKKLIGTILGVLAFAALIAGATYAALSVSATVTNGDYNVRSGNFDFNYSGDHDISGMLILGEDATYSQMTNAATGKYTLTVTKSENSPASNRFELHFHVNSSTITTSSIKYKVCATTDCTGTINGESLGYDDTAYAAGDDYSIYMNTTDFYVEGSASETYYIYFWLDDNTIVNEDIGKSISGYVYAHADQYVNTPS